MPIHINLLVSAIITWNTRYLGRAVQHLRDRGEDVPDEFLAHVWPTAWEHVNLTGTTPGTRPTEANLTSSGYCARTYPSLLGANLCPQPCVLAS
jgi:hypothetical protein